MNIFGEDNDGNPSKYAPINHLISPRSTSHTCHDHRSTSFFELAFNIDVEMLQGDE